MSRIGYIARNPKAVAGTLGTLLVAAGLTAGSGAVLTDSDSSAANSVVAGTADIVLYSTTDKDINGNNCRKTNDDFKEPSAYAGAAECSVTGVDAAATAPKTTFTVTNLSPGSPKIERCFSIKNDKSVADGGVPLGLKLDIVNTGADNALAKAMKITVERQGLGGADALSSAFLPNSGGTLSSQGPAGFVNADNIPNAPANSPTRRPLEPGETYKYCLELEVVDNNQNQNAIAGQTVTFDVNARAESLNGAL